MNLRKFYIRKTIGFIVVLVLVFIYFYFFANKSEVVELVDIVKIAIPINARSISCLITTQIFR